MLSKILREFEDRNGLLDLNELSRRLGVERSALNGMLDTLVRQGRLREVSLGHKACAHCPGCFSCGHMHMSNPPGRVYELAGKE
ncbi:MAG: FeoC-like transcriptional regulator [Chloroflexota bacterium]|nr:FeoC-like transcriptional regulator [Chloroflexota bacterium]